MTTEQEIAKKLLEVHGPENCHICGKPRATAHEALSICSYPHGMLPKTPVDSDQPDGFWSWEKP